MVSAEESFHNGSIPPVFRAGNNTAITLGRVHSVVTALCGSGRCLQSMGNVSPTKMRAYEIGHRLPRCRLGRWKGGPAVGEKIKLSFFIFVFVEDFRIP